MKPRPTEAEFDVLKRDRDAAIDAMIRAATIQLGGDPDRPHAHVSYGGGTSDCYCACADGGPCQHDWTGPQRDILDDNDESCGAEATCARCGMGAMQHSIATCWE